jgi:hypothetical protein
MSSGLPDNQISSVVKREKSTCFKSIEDSMTTSQLVVLYKHVNANKNEKFHIPIILQMRITHFIFWVFRQSALVIDLDCDDCDEKEVQQMKIVYEERYVEEDEDKTANAAGK